MRVRLKDRERERAKTPRFCAPAVASDGERASEQATTTLLFVFTHDATPAAAAAAARAHTQSLSQACAATAASAAAVCCRSRRSYTSSSACARTLLRLVATSRLMRPWIRPTGKNACGWTNTA